MTPNEKRSVTYQKKRERAEQKRLDHERTVSTLRAIRDDSEASNADRLRAIELLKGFGIE